MNKKTTKERARILQMLTEGNGIRSTARIAGVSINTIVKLLIEAGEVCAEYQDRVFHNLTCKRLQIDEIWAFIGMKEKNVPEELRGKLGLGDVWLYTSIDADTKLMPSWLVGRRVACDAHLFVEDLKSRLANKVQLTSDGFKPYLTAVEQTFGCEVDFAQVEKIFSSLHSKSPEARYSPGECCGVRKTKVEGNPDPRHVSTSFVERANLTIRMTNRRYTRLTNAYSRKLENHSHMVALHFMAYNFCKVHGKLRTSPAMAAGVDTELRDMEWVVGLMDAKVAVPKTRGPYKKKGAN